MKRWGSLLCVATTVSTVSCARQDVVAIVENCTPATELCDDDIDNNCDGQVDEAQCCTLSTTQLSSGSLLAQNPRLAWTGDQYAVSFRTMEAAPIGHVVTVGRDGIPTAAPWRFDSPTGAGVGPPALAWADGRLALAFTDALSSLSTPVDAWLGRRTLGGATIGTDGSISATARFSVPDIVWNGSLFGVTWAEAPIAGPGYFRLFDAAMQPLSEAVRVTGGGDCFCDPLIVWTGTEWVVAYQNDGFGGMGYSPALLRVDPTGVIAGEPVPAFLETHAQTIAIVHTGVETGIAWVDPSGPGFARVQGDTVLASALLDLGEVIGPDSQLQEVALGWDGSRYVLAFSDWDRSSTSAGVDEFGWRVHLMWIAPDGTTGPHLPISADNFGQIGKLPHLSVMTNGSEVVLVWTGGPAGTQEIFMTRASCL